MRRRRWDLDSLREEYDQMLWSTPHPWCWACGRDERQCPRDWYAPWYLQLAHLGHGSGVMRRQEDRRGVNILCSRCHMLHTPCQIRVNGELYEPLTSSNMLWLKQLYDADYFDMDYLRSVFMQTVPSPESLPDWYEHEYALERGRRP